MTLFPPDLLRAPTPGVSIVVELELGAPDVLGAAEFKGLQIQICMQISRVLRWDHTIVPQRWSRNRLLDRHCSYLMEAGQLQLPAVLSSPVRFGLSDQGDEPCGTVRYVLETQCSVRANA